MAPFANLTLSELGGASATVFLPAGVLPSKGLALPAYYESSRFEWGSMIGLLRPRATGGGVDIVTSPARDVLYGTDLWRTPHDPLWPESGVGLASEFGYGDDGAACVPGYLDGQNVACGWVTEAPKTTSKITNGVLGYEEAGVGEPFLKIGVGKLVKGSCESCDAEDLSPEGYKFNSPYRFFENPSWQVIELTSTSITMEHEAVLKPSETSSLIKEKSVYGYRIRKKMSLADGAKAGTANLFVETSLTNLGSESFATPWYSHHFFTCDGAPVGANGNDYSVDLDIIPSSQGEPMYGESGVGIWSTPLEKYARVIGSPTTNTISVVLDHEIEDGIKIKAEFPDDGVTTGSFLLHGCGTTISESVPQWSRKGPIKMYAYNLYAERGTLSPEPLFLVSAAPGETVQWTQQLSFRKDHYLDVKRTRLGSVRESQSFQTVMAGLVLIVFGVGIVLSSPYLRSSYSPIE